MKLYRGNRHLLSTPRRRMCRFLIIMPVILFAYLLAVGDSGLYQVWHRGQQITALRQGIDSLKSKNAHLQEEVALLKSDLRVIERIARERYGMVKAKESVYMVYPDLPQERPEGGR